MPMYEYRCTSCGERLEVLQHMGAAPLLDCPECHGVLEKMISAPALHFKGSGWYVTDYGKSAGRKAAESKANGTSGTGEAAKKEPAPAPAVSSESKPSAAGS